MASGLSDSEIDKMGREPKRNFWRVFEAAAQSCAAEFLGTLILVFISCLVSAGVRGTGMLRPEHINMIVPISLCAGFTVAGLMAAFGNLSGGHFNPAVSLAVCLAGHHHPSMLCLYVVMQLLGATFGAAIAVVLQSKNVFERVLEEAVVELSVDPGRAILCEFMMTAFVVLAVLLTTVEERTKHPGGPTAVGFAYVVCAMAGLQITGSCLNPARSFGYSVVMSIYTKAAWDYQYVYWVGPGVAGVVVAVIFRYMLFRKSSAGKENNLPYKYTQIPTESDSNQIERITD